ncbi:MAG TPA: ribosome biogenesis GTPase Der [Actinomycetota bacterium]|nr:ribosome biogenesis GTPase Der [Actinomycetota bacterium]
MTTRLPRIAVIGRQNVGKSTLVNRLFGRREAIADDLPGVTRDRIEFEATWRGRRFGLVDTAGFLSHPRGIEALAGRQAERAAEEADLVLLVVDARAGITEEDSALGRRMRRAGTPVLVVANKVDTDADEADASSFHALGLGEPFAVSALHGRSAGDLLDRLVQLLPEAPEEVEASPEPRFAIVGRPNVGKSSLFNRLVGEERSVVYEEAGTTRDSVDALVTWSSGTVRFIDTAGMRRQVKAQGVEYYSFVRASGAIDRADVTVVVIDAVEGLTAEDKRIASRVIEAGRGLMLVANKWDLVEEKDRTYKQLGEGVRPLARAAVMRTSAKNGQGVHRLPPALVDLHGRWASRAPTARVNEIVQQAQGERPTPRDTGTIHYATQVTTGPPSFVLFGGKAPDAPYRRYLENRLRAAFDLQGVPIRLTFRQRRRSPRA